MDAKALAKDTDVVIRGKVVATEGRSAYVSDATGGIYVYNFNSVSTDTALNSSKNWTLGDFVEVKARVAEYKGGVQLSNYANKARIAGTYAVKVEDYECEPLISPITSVEGLDGKTAGNIYSFEAAFASGSIEKATSSSAVFKLGGNDVTLYTSSYDTVGAEVDDLIPGVYYDVKAPQTYKDSVGFAAVNGASVKVSATHEYAALTSFEFDGAPEKIAKDATAQLKIKVNDGADPRCTFASSDASVISVDEKGVIKGIAESGSATITATSKVDSSKTATATIAIDAEAPAGYTLLTSLDQVTAGLQVVIGSGSSGSIKTLKHAVKNNYYMDVGTATVNGNVLADGFGGTVYTIEAGASDGTFKFKASEGSKPYLCHQVSGKYHNLVMTANGADSGASWTVTADTGNAFNIKNNGYYMEYYSSKGDFTVYSKVQKLYLFGLLGA